MTTITPEYTKNLTVPVQGVADAVGKDPVDLTLRDVFEVLGGGRSRYGGGPTAGTVIAPPVVQVLIEVLIIELVTGDRDGIDLPNLPNLPNLPGPFPDLPDLPDLPKIPLPGGGGGGGGHSPSARHADCDGPSPDGSPAIDPRDVANHTPSAIDQFARRNGLRPVGSNPMSGQGAYLDPVTGQQRILIHTNARPPHAHVNTSDGERLDINCRLVPPESPDAHLPILYP